MTEPVVAVPPIKFIRRRQVPRPIRDRARAMIENRFRVVPVCQGELSVSAEKDVVLSCILGSCIATCLHDPQIGAGGMNHILLPGRRHEDGAHNRFGVYAMESLINELMRLGASRRNLVAKFFGGATTFDNGLGIGRANAVFVREFLDHEGIPIAASSVGGRQARRIRFYPHTGEAKEMLTADTPAEPSRPRAASPGRLPAVPPGGSGRVELF